MNAIDRAHAYLEKLPPAIAGQGGHNATFTAAARLVHGFALSEADACRLLILIRYQDETNCGRVAAWQDHAG